jgi:hypothetical protein
MGLCLKKSWRFIRILMMKHLEKLVLLLYMQGKVLTSR